MGGWEPSRADGRGAYPHRILAGPEPSRSGAASPVPLALPISRTRLPFIRPGGDDPSGRLEFEQVRLVLAGHHGALHGAEEA